MLCHFQYGKDKANDLLSKMTRSERHVPQMKPVIFQSFGLGFYSRNRPKSRRVYNERVKQRRLKQMQEAAKAIVPIADTSSEGEARVAPKNGKMRPKLKRNNPWV